jgi:hypothetical protein
VSQEWDWVRLYTFLSAEPFLGSLGSGLRRIAPTVGAVPASGYMHGFQQDSALRPGLKHGRSVSLSEPEGDFAGKVVTGGTVGRGCVVSAGAGRILFCVSTDSDGRPVDANRVRRKSVLLGNEGCEHPLHICDVVPAQYPAHWHGRGTRRVVPHEPIVLPTLNVDNVLEPQRATVRLSQWFVKNTPTVGGLRSMPPPRLNIRLEPTISACVVKALSIQFDAVIGCHIQPPKSTFAAVPAIPRRKPTTLQ